MQMTRKALCNKFAIYRQIQQIPPETVSAFSEVQLTQFTGACYGFSIDQINNLNGSAVPGITPECIFEIPQVSFSGWTAYQV